MLKIVTADTAARPRLELLLIAQQKLRSYSPHDDRHMTFEVARAIEELSSGYPTDHTLTAERWCQAYLGGAA